MKGLLQRVKGARVEVGGEIVGSIDQGLLVLLAVEPDEEIEVDTFYREFIRNGRGNATVAAEADSPIGKARITRLLHAIERNEHKKGRGGSQSEKHAPRAG